MIDVLAGFSGPLSGVLVHCSAVISDSKALCRGFRKIGQTANGLKKTLRNLGQLHCEQTSIHPPSVMQ